MTRAFLWAQKMTMQRADAKVNQIEQARVYLGMAFGNCCSDCGRLARIRLCKKVSNKLLR